MAGDFSTGKTILVLAIVVGCFAVLWPRVFYPMLISAPPPPPSKEDPASRRGSPPRPLPHDMLHPALRERANAYTQRGAGVRGGSHPGLRPPMAGGGQPPPPTAPHKASSSMSVIMPLYTVGIIIFFLYTIMKVLTKKPCAAPASPRVKDFHMDPEQRKFVFAEEYVDRGARGRGGEGRKDSAERGRRQATPKPGESRAPEPRIEDEQMEALRLRLENTERAMERLMAQMGSVSEKLSSASINEVLSQAQQESFKSEASRGSSKASSVDIDEYELVQRDSSRENSVPIKEDPPGKDTKAGSTSEPGESLEEEANTSADVSTNENLESTQKADIEPLANEQATLEIEEVVTGVQSDEVFEESETLAKPAKSDAEDEESCVEVGNISVNDSEDTLTDRKAAPQNGEASPQSTSQVPAPHSASEEEDKIEEIPVTSPETASPESSEATSGGDCPQGADESAQVQQ